MPTFERAAAALRYSTMQTASCTTKASRGARMSVGPEIADMASVMRNMRGAVMPKSVFYRSGTTYAMEKRPQNAPMITVGAIMLQSVSENSAVGS